MISTPYQADMILIPLPLLTQLWLRGCSPVSLMPETHKPDQWAKFLFTSIANNYQMYFWTEIAYFRKYFLFFGVWLFKQWNCHLQWDMIAGFGPGCIIQTTIFRGKIRLCLHQQINRCNRNKTGRLKQLLPRTSYINDPRGLPLLDLA